ncbi:MAG: phage tail protein [bacterium]
MAKYLSVSGLQYFYNQIKTKFAAASHSHSNMKGATSSAVGTAGLVPAPAAGSQATKYLRADGTWQVPPDTKYTHPTSAGNKHIPSGGSSGQILRWSADGTAAWGADGIIGEVKWYAGKTVPSGYLLCNGAKISRTTYKNLFNVIGTTYGTGDGSTTFTLPNLIDKFIQGAATPGTVKAAGLPNITGSFTNKGLEVYNSCDLKDGVFSKTTSSINNFNGHNTTQYANSIKLVFDASSSNTIYGNSDTVQPPALTMLPIIKY